jgi:hypothetical protein
MNKLLYALAASALVVAGFGALSAQAVTLSPPIVEINAKRGEAVAQVVKLYNEGDAPITVTPSVQSFRPKNETGTPEIYDDKSGLDLQGWITAPVKTVIQPGERKSFALNIDVPASADPGGHYAVVLWGVAPGEVTGTTPLSINGQVGTLVLVRVEGPTTESGKIIEFGADQGTYTHLPTNFVVRFQNSGTVHLHPTGDVVVRNLFGGTAAVIPFNDQANIGNILPKSIRRFDFSWMKAKLGASASEWEQQWKNFAFGPYTATLAATYGSQNTVANATVSFWVIPWMVLIFWIVIIILIVIVVRELVRKYNKYVIAQYERKGKMKK